MTRRPTAVVIRTMQTIAGGWRAYVTLENGSTDFIPVSEPHPEGTRLTLVNGEWRKL